MPLSTPLGVGGPQLGRQCSERHWNNTQSQQQHSKDNAEAKIANPAQHVIDAEYGAAALGADIRIGAALFASSADDAGQHGTTRNGQ